MDVRQIISVMIVLVVGLSLTPVVKSFTDDAIDGENADNTADDMTGASATMLNLVPLFYVIGLLLAVIYWATGQAKKSG